MNQPSTGNLHIDPSVTIGKFTVIGEDGFGFTKDLKFREHKFGVTIGKDVWIGSNTSIDRGRWRDTAVNGGVKIDNHVHIGHNAIIGSNTVICAGAVIGGSCDIGRNCEIGLGAIILPGVRIWDGCVIAAGAVVRYDVPADMVYISHDNIKKKTKKDYILKSEKKVKKERGGCLQKHSL